MQVNRIYGISVGHDREAGVSENVKLLPSSPWTFSFKYFKTIQSPTPCSAYVFTILMYLPLPLLAEMELWLM